MKFFDFNEFIGNVKKEREGTASKTEKKETLIRNIKTLAEKMGKDLDNIDVEALIKLSDKRREIMEDKEMMFQVLRFSDAFIKTIKDAKERLHTEPSIIDITNVLLTILMCLEDNNHIKILNKRNQ